MKISGWWVLAVVLLVACGDSNSSSGGTKCSGALYDKCAGASGCTSGLCQSSPSIGMFCSQTCTPGQGWGWVNGAYWLSQPTTLTFAGSGSHTLRIQVREDGVQFDQIVLSPSQYLNTPPGPASNDATIVPKP